MPDPARRPAEPDADPDPEPDRGTPEWPRGPRRRERDPDDNGFPDEEPEEGEEPDEDDGEEDDDEDEALRPAREPFPDDEEPDEDEEEPGEDETLDQAGAVTTSGHDWNRPPGSRPPAAPITPPPTPPPAASGGNWRKPRNGATYTLSGTEKGGVKWSGVSNVTLKGPATIKGGSLAALDLRNCTGCTFEDLTFAGAKQNGVYADGGSHLTFRRCTFRDCKEKSGLLFHNVDRVLVEDCKAHNVGEHCIYWSGGGSDQAVIRRCTLTDAARCSIQINPEGGEDSKVTGGRIEACVMERCASKEGAALNLGAWVDGVVKGCAIRNNKKGIALWKGDGSVASRNIRIEGNTFEKNGAYTLKCTNGSSGHTLSGNRVDKKPDQGGWTSDGTNVGPGTSKW